MPHRVLQELHDQLQARIRNVNIRAALVQEINTVLLQEQQQEEILNNLHLKPEKQ